MNNYHIYEEVGRGKFSVVYKGRKKQTFEYVAVKSVDHSRRRKLSNEYKYFTRMNHKNIVKFHNRYETRNHLWMVFEYCSGGDLSKIIEQDKKLPEETVKRFAFDLSNALSYLHHLGIIYCDLKPQNILLNEYHALKLFDFGLAQEILGLKEEKEFSKLKTGTPYYMAPELFGDNGIPSFQSDFWSLGCVLFELATGAPPFSTSSLKELISMIVEKDFPRVTSFSPEFNDLLKRLLEKDPLRRMTWDELKGHAWWQCGKTVYELAPRQYPQQVQFDSYLKSRGINPDHYNTSNSLAKKFGAQMGGDGVGQVDILRLSHNVKKHVQNQVEGENQYQEGSQLVSGGSNALMNKAREEEKRNVKGEAEAKEVDNDDYKLKGRAEVLHFGDSNMEDDSSSKKPWEGSNSGSSTPHSSQQPQNFIIGGGDSSQKKGGVPLDVLYPKNTGWQQQQDLLKQEKIDLRDEDEKGILLGTGKFGGEKGRAEQKGAAMVDNFVAGEKKAEVVSGKVKQIQITQKAQKELLLIMGLQMFDKAVYLDDQISHSQAKVPQKSIEQLIIHSSDTAVKPIIGNKEIERTNSDESNKLYGEQLGFKPWTPEQVLQQIDTPEVEEHLADVYHIIASNSTLAEKADALQYFESIIVDSQVSNRLINSAFTQLLIKLLKMVKSPTIKIHTCSVLGKLIRHSTVIENDLAQSEACLMLIETLKEKNDRVKKKAIAALGEYLFYAATQLEDEQGDSVWEISSEAIGAIVENLRQGEDPTIRFYACKTVENITAQSNSAGMKFATQETTMQLLKIFLESKMPGEAQQVEGIKVSAAVALGHIIKLNPNLFGIIFERISPRAFISVLADGQSRVQQAFITMLNMALAAQSYPKLCEILLTSDQFLKSLAKLLDHHSIVIRGKCLLSFLLLFKLDFRWMAVANQEVKFFSLLDRLTRDNYKYVQCCLLCLVNGILELVPLVFKSIAEELNIMLNGGKSYSIESEFERRVNRTEFEQLSGNMVHVSILLDLLGSQVIKARLLNEPFLRSIATFLDVCEVGAFPGAEEFLNPLLLITEAASSNNKALMQMNEPILNYMLPVLLSKVKSESADIRFLSLKIFTDIIIQYLHDESIYDGKGEKDPKSDPKSSTSQINELISQRLFPLFSLILADNDPVPLFGLKLLAAIIERNIGYVRLLKQHGLFAQIADYYSVNNQRLNRHTIKVVKSMVEAKVLSLKEFGEFLLDQKTTQITKVMIQNKQDWCIEILLDILHELLEQFVESVKRQDEQVIKYINEIFIIFDQCVQLLSPEYDLSIAEKASQVVVQMLQVYALGGQKLRQIYFVESHLENMMFALKSNKKIVQKRILKCLYWALIQTEYSLKMQMNDVAKLEELVAQLQHHEDKSIASTSREIFKILQELRAYFEGDHE